MLSSKDRKRKNDERGAPTWWCDQDGELIARIIEINESLDESHRYERKPIYDWDAIAPAGMTGTEAEQRWDSISRDIPRRRTNLEIARIVQKNFNGARLKGKVLTPSQFTKVAGMRRQPIKLKAQDLYPDIPKRPMSAFFLWAEDNRETVRTELSNAPAKEIQRILGERWRSTPEGIKDTYKKRAHEAMEKYYSDMETFYELHPEAKTDKKLSRVPLKKTKVQDEAPKPPPRSGYLLFLQEVRPSMPEDMPFTEAVKLIATQWHELSEEVRKSYTTRLEDLWAKYESDWQMFISSIPEHQQAELEKARRSQFTKGRTISTVGIKVGFPPKLKEPVKPTAYKMFVAANKDQVETRLPEDERAKVHAKLREMWKILDPKAKEPFEAEAKRAEHKYHQDWLEYERMMREQNEFAHAAHAAHAAHHAHHPHHPHHAHHAAAAALPPPPPSNMSSMASMANMAAVAATVAPAAPQTVGPPVPTQFYPLQKTQWLFKNQMGKYEHFADKDSEVLNSAIREWDARGRQPSHIQIQLMGHPCVVDLVNMTFQLPGREPVKIKSKLYK